MRVDDERLYERQLEPTEVDTTDEAADEADSFDDSDEVDQ